MKERPILFTPSNVMAILTGKKTQTRRIVKPQPEGCDATARWSFCVSSTDRKAEDTFSCSIIDKDGHSYTDRGKERRLLQLRCPYGLSGDRLWVREPFSTVAVYDATTGAMVRQETIYRAENPTYEGRWTPSIHMPRSASRLVLELTEVRVERLQAITPADALAEKWGTVDALEKSYRHEGMSLERWIGDTEGLAVDAYRQLWESINGVGSWALNPWVWVLTFKKLAPAPRDGEKGTGG